jgi:hypothetical protein
LNNVCARVYHHHDDDDKKGNGMQRFSVHPSQALAHQGQWVDVGDPLSLMIKSLLWIDGDSLVLNNVCAGAYHQDDNDKKGNGMQRFSLYPLQVWDHQGQWVDVGDNE